MGCPVTVIIQSLHAHQSSPAKRAIQKQRPARDREVPSRVSPAGSVQWTVAAGGWAVLWPMVQHDSFWSTQQAMLTQLLDGGQVQQVRLQCKTEHKRVMKDTKWQKETC